MARKVIAFALLVVLASLAGCNGLFGGQSTPTPDSDEISVTPAPVPSPPATPTVRPFPPGVSADRVDAARLASAHAQRLRAHNYTLAAGARLIDANGTVSKLTRRRRVAAGGDRYAGGYGWGVAPRGVTSRTNDVDYWRNESGYVTRTASDDGSSYFGFSRTGDPVGDVDGSQRLNRTLGAFALTVTERTATGVVLTGRGLTDPERLSTPAYVTGPTNASITVRVRRDGVVTEWRLTYDARLGGRLIRVVQTFEVTDVGTTTVERPRWFDLAWHEDATSAE